MIATINSGGMPIMLDTSKEANYMMGLENYRARQLYGLLKEQQPERFNLMKKQGTLLGYLNSTSWPYYQMATLLVEQGMTIPQAEELAWQDLMERAGL